MAKIRLLVLDTTALDIMNAVREIEVEDLDDYYKYLNCDTFDIANRQVGNSRYDLFVDDEGLLKDNSTLSACNEVGEPMLVGNIIFARHDDRGNTIGLTDADIMNIKKNIVIVLVKKELRPILICDY